MKKATLIFTLVFGTTTFLIAQDAKTKAENNTSHSPVVKSAATQNESGEEKGKTVAETAKSKSKAKDANRKDEEMKAKAGEKGQIASEERKAKAAGREKIENQEANSTVQNDNHGHNVKTVATDENISGKEKGAAVKSTASEKGETMRNEKERSSHSSTRNDRSLNQRNSARPEKAAARPSTARRPASAGRPAAPGRPAN